MKKNLTLKTVRQHIEDIKNDEIRAKCLENLDERCAEELCYSAGYALMLGVTQGDRNYWDKVYWELNKESPGYEDTSRFYTYQEVQQEPVQPGKKK